MVWHYVIWYGVVVLCSVVLCCVLWCCVLCCVVVWYGMVWYGLVYHLRFSSFFSLMRKCYEQLALFYLAKTQQVKDELNKQETARNAGGASKLSRAAKLARKDEKPKEKQEMLLKRETKKELRATWIAARAMATISAVIDTRGQLHGNLTGLLIPKTTGEKIPLPVIHDLLGSLSIVTNTEDGSYMQEDGVVTMDTFINSSNTVQLTWNHLLCYIEYLQRQVSYQALGIRTSGGPLFRWPQLLKLHQMHEFLGSELEVYFKKNYGVYSSPLLLLPDVLVKQSDGESRVKGVVGACLFHFSDHGFNSSNVVEAPVQLHHF